MRRNFFWLSPRRGGGRRSRTCRVFGPSWSNNAQLLWIGKAGDTLTLTLPAQAAGTYDLVGYFTKAADYGQASFALNGSPLTTHFDGYHDGVIPSGPVVPGDGDPAGGPVYSGGDHHGQEPAIRQDAVRPGRAGLQCPRLRPGGPAPTLGWRNPWRNEAPPLICPACGGANAPSAVFCANPACHKALGDFKYVQEELKKDARWHESLADRVVT